MTLEFPEKSRVLRLRQNQMSYEFNFLFSVLTLNWFPEIALEFPGKLWVDWKCTFFTIDDLSF